MPKIQLHINETLWSSFFSDILAESIYDYRLFSLIHKTDSSMLFGSLRSFDIRLSFKKDTYGLYGSLAFGCNSFSSLLKSDQEILKKKILQFLYLGKMSGDDAQFDKLYYKNDFVQKTGVGVIEFPLGESFISTEGSIIHCIEALNEILDFIYFEAFQFTQDQEITFMDPGDELFKKMYAGSSQRSFHGKSDDLPSWLESESAKDSSSIKTASAKDGLKKGPSSQYLVENLPKLTLNDIGGNAKSKDEIRKLISFFKNKSHFDKWNITPPKGVILYGPPGTGKTMMSKIIASETGMNFYSIASSDIISKWIGDSARNLKAFFKEIETPCIVFFDEIDALVPNRTLDTGTKVSEEEIQMINQLLQEMDGVNKKQDILFIGATNRIEAMDPAILRAGRLDYKIFLDYPDFESRKEIWSVVLNNASKNVDYNFIDEDLDLEVLAKITDSFTGADIAEIVSRMLRDYALGSLVSEKVIEIINGQTTLKGLQFLIEKYKNEKNLNRSIIPVKPTEKLSDFIAPEHLKKEILKIIKQFKNKEVFEEIGVELPRGILLYGPPGTGKTLAAKVIASELGEIFYVIQPKDFMSKWVNESLLKLESILNSLQTPCILFLDEIDALLSKRQASSNANDVMIVNTFLQYMDGFKGKKSVLFIGATNRLDAIDDAVLRAGRFDLKILVDLPDESARELLFRLYIEKSEMKNSKKKENKSSLFQSEIDYQLLSKESEGLSGADISEIIRRVKQNAVFEVAEQLENEIITSGSLEISIGTETILQAIGEYMKEAGRGEGLSRIGFRV